MRIERAGRGEAPPLESHWKPIAVVNYRNATATTYAYLERGIAPPELRLCRIMQSETHYRNTRFNVPLPAITAFLAEHTPS